MFFNISAPPLTNARPFRRRSCSRDDYSCKQETPVLVIQNTTDLQEALEKFTLLNNSLLHLVVRESQQDCDDELLALYNLSKKCRLDTFLLRSVSITYHAHNNDDSHNPIRLMTIVNLLNQLDWNSCNLVRVDLHINYLHEDPRLKLIEDLPVIITVHGKTLLSKDVSEDAKLSSIAQSYPYLEGSL